METLYQDSGSNGRNDSSALEDTGTPDRLHELSPVNLTANRVRHFIGRAFDLGA